VWTEEFRVRFPVQGASLGRFSTLLEMLDQLPDVSWFEVSGEAAVLGTPDFTGHFRPSGFTLYAYRSPFAETAEAVLGIVEEALKPPAFRLLSASQHLVPVDAAYEVATGAAASAWLGSPDATDCAVLVDGRVDALRARYQVEFGIVDRDETYERLARSTGRISTTDEQPKLPGDQYPAVAFFADFRWWSLGLMRVPGELVSSLDAARSRLQYAHNFTSTLQQRLARGLKTPKGDV